MTDLTNQTAQAIRADLKRSLPDFKFSVRMRRYSLGSSVYVSWTDGPALSEVEDIIRKHEHVRVDAWGEVLGGGNIHVHAHRSYSGKAEAFGAQYYPYTHRNLRLASFPPAWHLDSINSQVKWVTP